MYPGVAEALRVLGGRKSTATTKGTPTTRAVLEQFGLISYFDHVQGTDGIPCKPAPDVRAEVAGGAWRRRGRLPDGRRCSGGHGSRAARRREDLRRPLRLRESGGDWRSTSPITG